MKTLLSLKYATGRPADGIDNFNQAIFGRMDGKGLELWAEGNIAEKGAIKKLTQSKLSFLMRRKPEAMWGTGHAKELLFLIAAKILRPRTRYAITFHTVMFRTGPWKVRTPWLVRKFIFDRANLILCPSEYSANTVRRFFPKKNVKAILNGVDLNLFDPKKKNEKYLAEKYKLDFSKPVVAFVGALQARKRPDLFIELARQVPEANFIAVGRAVSEFDCLTAAKEIKNFQWIPSMPREDVGTFLATSAIFVFPSLEDASAAVILEAMASGAVPIVSASGGSTEFFANGKSGFQVAHDGNEKENFLAHIKELLKNEVVRSAMAHSARLEAEGHSWDIVAKQYETALCNDL